MLNASGFARARPIRVAFLVPEDEHAHTLLDAVIANCHARWGGRYSLIVPCEGGQPRSAYLPWLDVFDADIIYSYVDMDEEAVARIHERFGPSYLVRHAPYDQGQRDKRYFRPELPISCLTSLAVAPQYGRAHPPSAPQPMLIVDRLAGEPDNRFVDDNFGSTLDALEFWPLPDTLADIVRPLYLASKDLLANWRSGRIPSGEFVADVPALLTTMAHKHNTFGLAQLAADSAPHFEISDLRDDAFRLIVGDSFADRLTFWNDRSRFPAYLGRSFTTLIVPPALLDDTAFFTALVEFLKTRNNLRQSNGPRRIELVSTSVPLAHLQAHAARLQMADISTTYYAHSEVLIGDVPNEQALCKARLGFVSGSNFDTRSTWREFPAGSNTTTPPLLVPTILDGFSAPQAIAGYWATDVRLQRQNNLTRFSNVRHEWKLPRRLRLQGAFLKSHAKFPRTTADGALTFYTRINEPPPNITLPDDRTALIHSILHGRNWPPFRKRPLFGNKTSEPRNHPYAHIEPSDKGRYLLGTIGLFGGLQKAGQVLLHGFWKQSFDMLGAALGTDRKQDILKVLRKKLKSQRLETPDEWERLASVVATEAQRVRMPLRTIGFDQLKEQFEPYLAEGRRISEEHTTGPINDWFANASESLPESVRMLCVRNVLYQGYEWRCHKCFHTNWSDVRSLQPVLTCTVCQTGTSLAVDKPWDFRLNDFLREALKEHGVLALVWCLLQLEEAARESFYFLEPTALFLAYPQNRRTPPTNEADLICVIDGKVYLCEVKSSSRSIALTSFIQVAKQMRPDVAILAVMEPASQALSDKLDELKRALEPDGIQAKLLTFSELHVDKTAYLPSEE